MDQFFPWNEIADDNVLPEGVFQMRTESLEDGQANSGKRMFRAQFSVVAPLEFSGTRHFENFVTGNDEAPTAILPGAMGTKALKKYFVSAQIPQSESVGQICASAIGSEFLVTMTVVEDKDGPFKGTRRNRITRWWKLGEKDVGVAPADSSGRGVTSGVRSSAPPAPSRPAVPQSVANAIAPKPPGVPAPGSPSVGSGGATEQTIVCTICGQAVPVSEFGAHMQTHVSK